MRKPMIILAVVAGAYVLICAIAYVLQPHMVFFPDRHLVADPTAVGLDFRDVQIDTDDGERLHGWFVPGAGDQVVLFFHGNAGNISHRLESIRLFHELGSRIWCGRTLLQRASLNMLGSPEDPTITGAMLTANSHSMAPRGNDTPDIEHRAWGTSWWARSFAQAVST